MNFHQTPEQIVKAATADQRLLWNYIFLLAGDKIGVSQFYYHGLIAGSEFLNYSANKLYISYSFSFGNTGGSNANSPFVQFFDRLNISIGHLGNGSMSWDTTAAAFRYAAYYFDANCCLFSRIVVSNYNSLKFIGYRLSI